MKYEVVKDKYTKVRGGSAKFYLISCVKCGKIIFIYQKDGPGSLVRMYLDKFVAPRDIADKLKKIETKSEMSGLRCPNCNELLGIPMIYEKENRLAFRLLSNKVHRKEKTSPLEFDL